VKTIRPSASGKRFGLGLNTWTLDTSAWTEDEKGAFNQTLQNLHESIQAILNPSEAPRNLA
jgi:hypothetical protein